MGQPFSAESRRVQALNRANPANVFADFAAINAAREKRKLLQAQAEQLQEQTRKSREGPDSEVRQAELDQIRSQIEGRGRTSRATVITAQAAKDAAKRKNLLADPEVARALGIDPRVSQNLNNKELFQLESAKSQKRSRAQTDEQNARLREADAARLKQNQIENKLNIKQEGRLRVAEQFKQIKETVDVTPEKQKAFNTLLDLAEKSLLEEDGGGSQESQLEAAKQDPNRVVLNQNDPDHVEIARQLLEEAGGDVQKARELAQKQGFFLN